MTAPFKTATIDERVATGAAWLDEHRPGWVDRIDLDTLDLGEPCRCVLGQLYGDFWDAPAIFSPNGGDLTGADCGFNIDYSPRTTVGYEAEFTALTQAWRRLILARREGGAA